MPFRLIKHHNNNLSFSQRSIHSLIWIHINSTYEWRLVPCSVNSFERWSAVSAYPLHLPHIFLFLVWINTQTWISILFNEVNLYIRLHMERQREREREREREVLTRIHGLGSNVTLVQHTLESLFSLESWDPSNVNEMVDHDHDWYCSCYHHHSRIKMQSLINTIGGILLHWKDIAVCVMVQNLYKEVGTSNDKTPSGFGYSIGLHFRESCIKM